jgi:hypothetical protein
MHVISGKNRARMFSPDLAQAKLEQPVQAQAVSNLAHRSFTAL